MIGESLMKRLITKVLQDKGKPTRSGEVPWGSSDSRELLPLWASGVRGREQSQEPSERCLYL